MNTGSRNNYRTLVSAWGPVDERFFVAYALRGHIVNHADGVRTGLPDLGPIDGPVHEPSPLNVEWRKEFAKYNDDTNSMGIL